MGLFGSVIGGLFGSQAAGQLGSQYGNAENGVLGATSAGGAQVNKTINDAGTNINNAGTNATATVNDATGKANNTINSGVATANAGLSSDLATQTKNLQPYLDAGSTGAKSLQDYALSKPTFTAPTAAEVQATPGYQFQLQQGSNAITNQAAAQGLSQGGNTLKALTQYGQGLAGTYYQNAFNNAQNAFQTNQNTTLANLSALTNTGQTATGQFNQANQNAGNQIANNTMGGAGATANNTLNAGLYAGNTGTDLAKFLSTLQTQGSEFTAGLGLSGATTAGNFAVGKGAAQAGGTLATGNAINSGLSSLAGIFGGL